MKRLLSLVVLGLFALPAHAQNWYARGDFTGWEPTLQMMDQGNGYYTLPITGLAPESYFEFKIARDTWNGEERPFSNAKVLSNTAGEIFLHFWDIDTWDDGWLPNNSERVGYNDHNLFDWEIVGDMNMWNGGSEWFLNDQGNGLHTGSFMLNAGTYNFKFRQQGDWATSIGNDFGNGAGNNTITVTNNGDEWFFELDLPNGRLRAYTVAEPPGRPGDFNDDGFVDAADYVTWRKNDSQNQDGYNEWRANFGATPQWFTRGQFGDHQLVDQGDGRSSVMVTGLNPLQDYEFRVARDDFEEQVPGSGNMKVRANAAGEVTVNFFELEDASWDDGWSPANDHRVGYVDHNDFDWELAGEMNEWGGGIDWHLTDQGNGLHTGQFVLPTARTYQFKFRQQGSWDTSLGADFGNGAPNNSFTTTADGQTWNFELDLPNGRWRAYAAPGLAAGVPEPATLALIMLGALAVLGIARRRS
jgi:hypothetical protein